MGSPLCAASNALGRFKVYVDCVTRLCPMGGSGGGGDSGIGLCCALKSFAPRSDLYVHQVSNPCTKQSSGRFVYGHRPLGGNGDPQKAFFPASPPGRRGWGGGGMEGRGCRGKQGHGHISALFWFGLTFICLFVYLFSHPRSDCSERSEQRVAAEKPRGGGWQYPGAPRSTFPMCGTRPHRAMRGFFPGEHRRDAGSCGSDGADPLFLFSPLLFPYFPPFLTDPPVSPPL